ncbi:MAG: thiamine biosynthesis protein ThiS [Acidobacteria bacterium]|jgi:thiamine biosynthesis protein ThiS|nr:thiamine biosynthesis protein ThiS [Acidobacteriota bacterium]
MKLQINGEIREVPASENVRQLLENLKITPGRIAVEVNQQIVRRQDWEQTALREFDRVEIVQFVGGG